MLDLYMPLNNNTPEACLETTKERSLTAPMRKTWLAPPIGRGCPCGL